MDRQFFPGVGPSPFFSPFFNPFFFPQRQFSPFFFLSPFSFSFFRGEQERDGIYFSQHQCREGDTLGGLAQMYNCPQPILVAFNPHVQNPNMLMPGSNVHIPCLDKMYCKKLYWEEGAADGGIPTGYSAPVTSPYAGTLYPSTTPYTGAATSM
jgi:hypothetical protein